MRPALWMVAALAVGIAAAEWLRPHPAAVLAAVLCFGLWAAFGGRRLTLAFLATVAMVGAFLYAYDQTAGRGDLAAWQSRRLTIVGTATSEPELKKPRGVGYILAVEQVDGHPAKGNLYVTQWAGRAPAFGERVEVRGTLKVPQGPRIPGGFDQAEYLGRQGVYFTLEVGEARLLGPGALNLFRRAAVATRIRLESVLKATLPPRDAALMAGLLFGSRSELPDDIKEAFKASGVFHLLAVSGGNVAMVIMPILSLLRLAGLSRRRSAMATIPVVVFFVFLTGASPSVMRAGLMAVLVLGGEVLGREKNPLNTLGAAALLLLLGAPGLLFDLGFQLSAGATLGILLFARPFEQWLGPRFGAIVGTWVGSRLAAGLSLTFAAQVLVEPISLYNFGAFSAIAPVANLLVLAFLEPVVQVGSVAVLIGLVAVPLAWAINWGVRLGLWLLVTLVKAMTMIPGAYLQVGRLPGVWLIAWYMALAIMAAPVLRRALLSHAEQLRRWWIGSQKVSRVGTALCLALVLAGGWTWRSALAAPPDSLVVTFLDVGQGDAILVQAPGGHAMLVDAGPASPPDPRQGRPGFDAGEEVVLPYLDQLGLRRLDYAVLTHPHQDHVGGLPAVLKQIKVGALLDPGIPYDAQGYRETLNVVAQQQIRVRRPVAGERYMLGPDVVLEVLHPGKTLLTGTRSDENSNSIVLRLRYRQVSILLTGDMEDVVEDQFLAHGTPVRADVLKVAHHGSGYSTSDQFLEAVKPRWAIISAGRANLFGHPDSATLARLRRAGTEVYRTDLHGSVTLMTNGMTIRVKGTKGSPKDEQYRPVGILGRRLIFAW